MLLQQSFNFLVRTYKDRDDKKDSSLQAKYKRKRLECCSDTCRMNQLCEEIWSDPILKAIASNYMESKEVKLKEVDPIKGQKPSVNLEKVAETLREIKLGKRRYQDSESALELCGEMFNAGYAEALLKHNI